MSWNGIGEPDKTKVVMTTISEDLTEAIDYKTFINIISNIPSCIFFKDRDLRYLFSSHLWREISGDDIVGKTDLEIRKDRDNALLAMESDRNIINTGKGCNYVIKSDIDGDVSYL